ncbi:hypothetical protein L249_0595 [Ophiocordyceps polyrhachis-furcata BCC 54312]|uniref:Tr-type G domain-containing protein n=1 Tax=Ophiocordyceps polyrhachis-furcata BCC 54312 TaxID=1330021 RepID=A0A367LCN1_9HYPO|nr:hypothetical protein L249_0595 [Ophiocordyceps polyrhachis-furcata BCC 54312]
MSWACKAGRVWSRRWLAGPRLCRRGFASEAKVGPKELEERIAAIPIERYRNFCIVAHIDHGKSTLSDRLLELTQTISKSDANKQILDKLDVERERGITVKAQTCSMIFSQNGVDYLLHLVDTPGHVDFRAEVTRSYASCGGALLLIDATQGIQAQTVSNFHLAFAQDLALVPVINKTDMPSADVPRVLEQMETTLELSREDALLVSAKTGRGVPALLPAVVERIPHPVGDVTKPLKVLLVDSWYDNFRGVVLLVRVFDGCVRAGDSVVSLGTGARYTVGQVGIQYPNATPQSVLRAGQVGYMFFSPGMKRIQDAKLGDTLTTVGSQAVVEPCPGFEEPKPMVFAAAFPTDQSDYSKLADSISQLVLNDRSVTLQPEFSEALGAGWRLGFLGSLHCSVFQDRLKQEHGRNIIITEPTVPTKIVWADGSEQVVQNPVHFPDATDHRIRSATLFEPYVHATITVPQEYLGRAIEICEANRGEQKSLEFFDAKQVILVYDIPAAQLVEDLFDKLKSASKGYATLDYEDAGWRESKLAKLQLLVNKQPVDAICRIVHLSQADRIGRNWATKFKDHVDRQMFEVVIQAVIGKKVLARETIKPFRKDVLAKLHASDITRRQKLLNKQKEGRKRLRAVGNVAIGQEAFQSFLSKLSAMCGRYALALRASQVRQMLQDDAMAVDVAPDDDDDDNDAGRQSYNFAPGYHGIVYRAVTPDWGAGPPPSSHRDDDDAQPEGNWTRYRLQAMKWGLIPFWTKRNPDYATMLKTINCRDDSLAAPGGMWAAIKGRKRCLVVAQGFYEWLKTGPRDKMPHFVRRRDGKLMCFAGLWDCVRYQASDEKTYSYTIITTDSNRQLRFLHDRMPVILDPGSEEVKTWLDPARHEWSGTLQSLLRPFDGELEVYPVSKEVGKVGNDSPSFIIPVDSKENKSNIANFFRGPGGKKRKPGVEGKEGEEDAEVEEKERSESGLVAAEAERSVPASKKMRKRDPTRNQGKSPVKVRDSGSKKITSFFGNGA